MIHSIRLSAGPHIPRRRCPPKWQRQHWGDERSAQISPAGHFYSSARRPEGNLRSLARFANPPGNSSLILAFWTFPDARVRRALCRHWTHVSSMAAISRRQGRGHFPGRICAAGAPSDSGRAGCFSPGGVCIPLRFPGIDRCGCQLSLHRMAFFSRQVRRRA